MSKSQVFVAGPHFLSYLPKNLTHLWRANCMETLYWCTVLVHQYGLRKLIKKHLEFTFSIKALSFHSRTSIRADKHIFQYLKWLYCWKPRARDSIPILVSRTVKTRRFKLLYFWNEMCYGNGNFYKDLLFIYL